MDEKVIEFMAEYQNRMKVSENRLKKLEDQSKEIYNLTISVKEMAINLGGMLEEQKEQNNRLKNLEEEPAKNWSIVWRTALTAVISAIVGAVTMFMLGH